jgi:hypothetical protein
MITRGIREFMARDWSAVRGAKDQYWAERIRRLGPLEALRIAEALRQQALAQQAGWPDATSRRADFSSHVRLAELLYRASAARRR